MAGMPLNGCPVVGSLFCIANGQMGPLGITYLGLLFQPSLTCCETIQIPSSLPAHCLNKPELKK